MQRQRVAGKPDAWIRLDFNPIPTCAGCQEPTATKAILEVLKEMGLEGEAIIVPGVGCHALIPFMLDLDHVMSAHGRPPDVASAIKRVLGRGTVNHDPPLVFTFQGDGDCIAIGAGSLINTASRGEKITVIMLNNVNYGTTGGQMSPTTPMGHVTSTTPGGRTEDFGFPVHVPEMLATFEGVVYTARGAVNTPANYQKTKSYIKKAFQKQMAGQGFGFVEVICSCPPDWHMTPLDSLKWIEQKIIPQFPLGEFKDVQESGSKKPV